MKKIYKQNSDQALNLFSSNCRLITQHTVREQRKPSFDCFKDFVRTITVLFQTIFNSGTPPNIRANSNDLGLKYNKINQRIIKLRRLNYGIGINPIHIFLHLKLINFQFLKFCQ